MGPPLPNNLTEVEKWNPHPHEHLARIFGERKADDDEEEEGVR